MFQTSYKNSLLFSKIRITIGLIVLLLTIFQFTKGQSEPKTRINCIVIDAGHGGKDPGAKGSKHYEKDVVLAIALRLGTYIKDNMPDVKVIFTRNTDVFIPLNERAEIANKNQADVFISIHCNSNPSNVPTGTETYLMGLTKASDNLEVAKKENSAINYEENVNAKYKGFDNSPESYIMLSLMQNTYRDQSIRLASFIQGQFKEKASRADRGVKQAGFLVLWQTAMPSVLVETGFLSNVEEEKYLASGKGQDYLASAIYRAFREYKNSIENKSVLVYNKPASSNDSNPKFPEKPDTMRENPTPVIILKDTTILHSSFYMVQILSSLKPIPVNSKLFKGTKNVKENIVDNRYKYTVGEYTSYKEVLRNLEDTRKTFPDAFIVGTIDGKFVTAKEVSNQIKGLN